MSTKRITDVGERLGGARKYQSSSELALPEKASHSAAEDHQPTITLKQIWPRPEFREIALSGKMAVGCAIWWMALYESLGKKPPLFHVKDAAPGFMVQMYERGIVFLRSAFERDAYSDRDRLKADYEAHMQSGQPERLHKVVAYATGRQAGRRLHHPFALTWEREVAMKSLQALGWPSDVRVRDNESHGVTWLTWNQRGHEHKTGWYSVVIKGRSYTALAEGPIADFDQAMSITVAAFAKELERREAEANQAGDRGKKKRKQHVIPIPRRPQLERAPCRVGPDWRQGRSIDAEAFKDEFRFRGVEFGNWVSQAEAQEFLGLAYDALRDLCDIMRLPPTFASLGGRLGIAFGSRGKGFAGGAAHYEPDRQIIHFTKTQGSGAIAHEFGHAFDAFMYSRSFTAAHAEPGHRYLSAVGICRHVVTPVGRFFRPSHADRNILPRDPHLDSAIVALRKAILGSTAPGTYVGSAAELDRGRKKPYWTDPTELFARAFECWMCDAMSAAERVNEVLVTGCEKDCPLDRWGLPHPPYPSGAQRAYITRAVGALVHTAANHWLAVVKARDARTAS
jgi:hypothetical protein